MSWFEHQSPAAIEVHSELPLQITLKLVATTREIPHHCQSRCGGQVVQSASKFLGTGGTVALLGRFIVIADVRQSGFRKDNVHSTDMKLNPWG